MNVESVLPCDAIPSIDNPTFGEEYFGEADDEVIVVDGDPPRAYPIRILSYHEVVNEVIDGRPIAVTWCPICWSAVVYDRFVDGRTLTFGMSGKLADDALVMYDRETESEWKQPTGAAIDGELLGATLSRIPSPMVSMKRFRADHPDGVVLQPVRGGEEPGKQAASAVYDMEPYERYVNSEEFGLYGMRGQGERRTWERTDLDAKTVVLGIEVDGAATGYPIPRVEAAGGLVTDTVGETDVLVVATDDGIHGFEDPGYDFKFNDGILRADGTTWDPVTGESEDGRRLTRIDGPRLFAFAWQDAHGEDAFYE